ncbi:MAG: hypothetical protein RL329_2007 [Bacteroidota bacterium]
MNELGDGTNAKLMIGFQKHYWRELGYQGLVYADNGVMNGWDNALLQTQDAENAGFSIFWSGNVYLPELEKIITKI